MELSRISAAPTTALRLPRRHPASAPRTKSPERARQVQSERSRQGSWCRPSEYHAENADLDLRQPIVTRMGRNGQVAGIEEPRLIGLGMAKTVKPCGAAWHVAGLVRFAGRLSPANRAAVPEADALPCLSVGQCPPMVMASTSVISRPARLSMMNRVVCNDRQGPISLLIEGQ